MENKDTSGYIDVNRIRLKKFGYNMIVLSVSIGLYYLGFFGTVEGPLNPIDISLKLKASGVSSHHLLYALIILFIISFTWNWMYNCLVRISLYFINHDIESKFPVPKPVKKGKWGNTLWAAFLIVILIVAFNIYKS